jgi:hypothetical protein
MGERGWKRGKEIEGSVRIARKAEGRRCERTGRERDRERRGEILHLMQDLMKRE